MPTKRDEVARLTRKNGTTSQKIAVGWSNFGAGGGEILDGRFGVRLFVWRTADVCHSPFAGQ